MLKELSLMAQIVSAVKAVLPHTELSVKLRSGFESPREMEKIIPALKEAGTDKFFFHYRTVRELYASGIPEREMRFRRMMELAGDTPVVLNGDFGGAEEIASQMKLYPCAGIMVGRKFLSDPGLFRQLRGEKSRSREEFCYALIRNGLAGEALKGMKRWIFGSWNYELPPKGSCRGE